ncbi:MAG: DUF2203 family protein [Deltaproteobacteria bacterium]|jgi:hypothetical protein|nr:DUF2203 family protein [Deltaproteobacteria bacterium]MBT6434926.1 DUF2203 family protein [Deltaproteobacteria bacterium]MBT6490412.1 DUF2203 family protein [Deltaproteobacteria bacterium]
MNVHSLEQANQLMPYLQGITQKAASEVLVLAQERDLFEVDEPGYDDCVEKIQGVIDIWVDQVDQAGAKPCGLWAVDFDKGDGYYSWKYPEPTLEYCRNDDPEKGAGKRELIQPEIVH